MSAMASSGTKQAQALNFSSAFPTDQIIYTKSDTVSWVAPQDFIYTTGLNDYCLPIAQFSVDGQNWFNQGTTDTDGGFYAFAVPVVSDDGVITISQADTPATPQTLRIRIMCLAHPNQKPFDKATVGSPLVYNFGFNYRKIAVMGVIQTPITNNAEDSFIMDIPHNLNYAPNYTIFVRLKSGNNFITTLLSPNARRRIYIDSQKLHIDNYMSNPLVSLQAFQYFYVIYYD